MSISKTRTTSRSHSQRSICINGETIPYQLQRSTRRRRTVQLEADIETGFKLMVPHTMSDAEIESFLQERSDWIMKRQESLQDTGTAKDWSNGGTTMLRGKDVEVIVSERERDDPGRDLPPTVAKSLEEDQVIISIPPDIDPEDKSSVIKELLDRWHRQEAQDDFKTRIEQFGNLMGVKPRQVKLSNAQKRWGSCSYRQSVNLSWPLIKLDAEIIDYVIVHELAHIIELNHSSNFWREVARIIPDHKEKRRALRKYTPAGAALL